MEAAGWKANVQVKLKVKSNNLKFRAYPLPAMTTPTNVRQKLLIFSQPSPALPLECGFCHCAALPLSYLSIDHFQPLRLVHIDCASSPQAASTLHQSPPQHLRPLVTRSAITLRFRQIILKLFESFASRPRVTPSHARQCAPEAAEFVVTRRT